MEQYLQHDRRRAFTLDIFRNLPAWSFTTIALLIVMSAAAVASRPPFQTVFRAAAADNRRAAGGGGGGGIGGGHGFFADGDKERKFKEWRARNLEKMKAANIKPKVYEFSRPPKVMEDRYDEVD